ncbi:MAG: DUF3536 domain-containing protein [Acidimicrobiia bacterium]
MSDGTDVALVVHGHFYQPPRENPWTEQVPVEPSAAPFHDGNARISAECYRPNGGARVVDDAGRVVDIVDNYERISFDVGPTLMSWLADHAPETYERILAADAAAGRAIAQAYGHAILPLCDGHDLRTQVRWGLADFAHRFGRRPAGMWLPETAVDDAVLRVLAEEGVDFTILAPTQVSAVRPLDGDGAGGGPDDGWVPVGGALDVSRPLRWRHPEDPSLGVDLVVYDGALSHDLAFAGVSSQALVARAVESAGPGGLVCAATDGETFGHHHTYADRGLAYALAVEGPRRGVEVPRLADLLARSRPVLEARVHTSSWSCVHGVERWRSDCGCRTGGAPEWDQRWRAPLRAALDLLRDWGRGVFERRGAALLRDPWAARDAYVEVVLGRVGIDRFLGVHLVDGADPVDALTLLEAQRHALLMYTSCGWFFNDLAGIETLQILRYAARAVDLHRELGEDPPLDDVLRILGQASSNRPEEGDGRRIWARHVEPSRVDGSRVAAHLALVDLLGGRGVSEVEGEGAVLANHRIGWGERLHLDRGGLAVAAGTVVLEHRRTRRRTGHAYAAVHLGGLEVFGAVRPLRGPGDGEDDLAALRGAFEGGARVTALLRLVGDRFGPREFGLEMALPDEAGQIVDRAAQALFDRFAATFDHLRSDHQPTLAALSRAGYVLPRPLRAPIEAGLARRFERTLAEALGNGSTDGLDDALAVARSAHAEGFDVATPAAAEILGRAVEDAAVAAAAGSAPHAERARMLLRTGRELGLELDLDRAQEAVFAALSAAPERAAHPLAPLGRALGVAV